MFVSSTSSDMHAEREALQRRGAHFLTAYLRRGVSEEIGFGQHTTPLCLSETRYCREMPAGSEFTVC